MKVKAIAMIIGASLVASTAYAANQGEGKITFTGALLIKSDLDKSASRH
ncbi:hypothetical protein [Serratia fonticola]